MNIYVLVKRTFDTEERITIKNGKLLKTVRNSSLTHTMNMQLKKRLRCVTNMAAK